MPQASQDLTEGERWTREQLATLLAGRFAPRAVGAFLLASQRRAADVRARRPALARQSRRWIAAGAAAYAVPVARGRASPGAAAGWWAATALMLDWHLGMLETPGGEPRPLGPADACTLARAWLVPVVAADPAPLALAAGGLTDLLDGRLARATAPTRAGRDLEGLVDVCFAVAALRGLRGAGRIPGAVVTAEVTRVSAGFAYALAVYFGRAQRPDDALLHAARATTGLRFGGAALAATGARRAGSAAVAAGSAWSLLELSRAVRASRAASRAGSASP